MVFSDYRCQAYQNREHSSADRYVMPVTPGTSVGGHAHSLFARVLDNCGAGSYPVRNNKDCLNIMYTVRYGNINLLKPTCYVMHQQCNIQQLYTLRTMHLCVLYLSENKQRLVPLTA